MSKDRNKHDEKNDANKHDQSILVDSKGRKKDHPNYDASTAKPIGEVNYRKDAMQELEDSIADLAKEVGGMKNQTPDSVISTCTARVQKALQVFRDQQ